VKGGFEITGADDVEKILKDIAPRHARNLMRATIHGVAGEIAKDAKRNAPKRSGLLKKSIIAKRRKSPPDAPVSTVNVEGKDPKNLPFYWRFIEYGTRGYKKGDRRAGGKGVAKKDMAPKPEQPFIRPAAEKARANFQTVLTQQFGKKLEAALKREAKKRAKK
jgi:HK97 gp10 family phage protein